MDISEFAVSIILFAGVKKAEKLDFDETNVVLVFNKMKFKDHMCVGMTAYILTLMVSVFDINVGPNLGCTSFLQQKLHFFIRPIQNMSLMSASDSIVQAIGKVLLFVQLVDLHVGVHFGVVDRLPVSLLVHTLCFSRAFNEMLQIKAELFLSLLIQSLLSRNTPNC